MENKKTNFFKPVDSGKKLSQTEEEVLKFWEENKIFEKSIENRKNSKNYTFYDGPPFATGLPHYGHIVGTFLKDVVPRYWTMKGFKVDRRWGWDCHGLPIENIVEKELGSKTKREIENLGVDKFNNLCRSKVLSYAGEWEKIIPRLGRWVDMKNAYRTMDLDYMESVWWTFKQLWDKDLIYQDYRSMHICPRCETTLSQSEVSEGYKDVKDLSVIAKFKLKEGQKINSDEVEDDTYILAWTTTPWTLPGNVALAVGRDIEYVEIEKKSDDTDNRTRFILAKNKLKEFFGEQSYRTIKKFKGSDLVGLKYEPLWDIYAQDEKLKNKKNGWQVVDADFVTTDEGTGIVHIAPAFGEDDMNLGKEKNLPFVQHVGMDGVIDKKVEVIGGLNVKPIDNPQATDVEVIKYLAGKSLLFHKEKYEHSYPHCWRCDTPLINYATSSWFVAVTKIKKDLLKNAERINWSPEHIKKGRFGKWLEGARDWSISRQRFWASVMPIWICNKCEEQKVFGSVSELESVSGEKIDDLHKHTVDKIKLKCEHCGGIMTRVPDVLDTWFDSGSMPYGQEHYPFENKNEFDKNFPADFIAEGVDQTRAWFYYLHTIAGGLFNKEAFKNVVVNGIVLAEDGKKMSKKLQNYPDPMDMVEKYGADPLRFYLMQSPVVNANNLNFNEKDLSEIARGTFRMLWQSYSFFVMYANVDNWKPKEKQIKPTSLLDKWIISELQILIKNVDNQMKKYQIMQATRLFIPFIDNLSNWYIRRSRKRFWKSENDNDKNEAYTTLHYVLVKLSKAIAPFAPFIADEIYRNLIHGSQSMIYGEKVNKIISVHLTDYPVASDSLIDEELNKRMKSVRDIITMGLQLRAKNQIKVRQPLQKLTIFSTHSNINLMQNKFTEIIKEELNVKEVLEEKFDFDENAKNMGEINEVQIMLDTEITPELKMEGQAREIIRAIQQMRKEADYRLDDRIRVWHSGMSKVFDKFGNLISKETLAKKIEPLQNLDQEFDLKKEMKIDEETLELAIKKN